MWPININYHSYDSAVKQSSLLVKCTFNLQTELGNCRHQTSTWCRHTANSTKHDFIIWPAGVWAPTGATSILQTESCHDSVSCWKTHLHNLMDDWQFIYVTDIRPVDVVNALSTVNSELLIGWRHHVCGLEVVDSL